MNNFRAAIHAAIWGADWSPAGIRPTLAAAAEIGYGYVVVPLRRFEDIQPDALARLFVEHGLNPLNTCGLSADRDIGDPEPSVRARGIEHLKRAIGMARDMGSSQINGVLYGPIGKSPQPQSVESWNRAATCMYEVAEYAENAGVRLALEVVNRYETPLLYNIRRGMRFLDDVGHSNIYLHIDTFHMNIEEADPLAMLELALPRLAYLELDQSHRGDAFEGSLDLVAWTRRAAQLGYEGIVGVEAFTRQLLESDHADALAIWEERFSDSKIVSMNFMKVIRSGFDI